MIVKCINDDWSGLPENHNAKAVLMVGDPLPEKGKEYEVIGYGFYESEEKGYELAGLDYSNYPFKTLLFKKERFEVVDNTFVPNAVTKEGLPCREENMYCSFKFMMPKTKMPRKMKKRFKKYGMTFVHNGKK